MKPLALISLIVSIIFSSCNQSKPKDNIVEVGENIDSLAIAQDTIQEKGIESSYEYFRSLRVSDKLVYDVIAYGGPPSRGEYAILRRGSDNKADTVFHAQRFGVIVNTFTGDLNSNGKEEIYVVMRKAGPKSNSYVTAVEFNDNGIATPLIFGDSTKEFTINTIVSYDTIRPKSDTIFIREDMIMKYYVHDKEYSTDLLNHAWQLEANRFVLIHND